jgi:cytochrome c556
MPMRRGLTTILATAGLGALLMTAALAATAADNQAAFEKRDNVMKQLGRNFYRGIGQVVQGKAKYGPDTVTAAQNTNRLAAGLVVSLFPPGSDVPKSKMKPTLPANPADIAALTAKVRQATAALVPAVQTGDPAKIAAAYKVADDSCDACHNKYRNK